MSPPRALLLLAGLLLLPGCLGWHPTHLGPENAPVVDLTSPVRATRNTGSSVVLWRPRIVGDSLIGQVGNPPLRTALALHELRRVEDLRYSRVRTGVAVVMGLSVGLVLFAVLGAIGAGPG